ncbi:hypothetical protein TEQG_08323, partial [Trichophyton equinum CBS 127.97]
MANREPSQASIRSDQSSAQRTEGVLANRHEANFSPFTPLVGHVHPVGLGVPSCAHNGCLHPRSLPPRSFSPSRGWSQLWDKESCSGDAVRLVGWLLIRSYAERSLFEPNNPGNSNGP